MSIALLVTACASSKRPGSAQAMPSASSTNGCAPSVKMFAWAAEHQCGLAVANLRIFIGGQHVRDVGKDLEIVRINTQCLAELADGLGVAALFEQRLAHLEMRPRVSRVKPRGFIKLAHGFVETPKFDKHDADTVIQAWDIWFEP